MRTVRLNVEIPNIPDHMTDDDVREWLDDQIGHPYDSYFEAGVRVTITQPPPPPFGAVIHPALRRKD